MTNTLTVSQLGQQGNRPGSAGFNRTGSGYNPRNMARSFLDDIIENVNGAGPGQYDLQRSYGQVYKTAPSFSILGRYPEGDRYVTPAANYYHPKNQHTLTHGTVTQSERDAMINSSTPACVGPNSYKIRRPNDETENRKSLGIKTDVGDQVADYIRNHPSGVAPNSYDIRRSIPNVKPKDPAFSMGSRCDTASGFVGPSCQDYHINRSSCYPVDPAFSMRGSYNSTNLANIPGPNHYNIRRPQSSLAGSGFGGRYKGNTF